MSHFKTVCRGCGDTISQCRCPSPSKEIRYDWCHKCKARDPGESIADRLLTEIVKAEKDGMSIVRICMKGTQARELFMALGVPPNTKEVWGIQVVGGCLRTCFEGWDTHNPAGCSREINLD